MQGKNIADGNISRLIFPIIPLTEQAIFPELRNKRSKVEAKIETLRTLKKDLDKDEYYLDLEKLLIELAKINDQIELSSDNSK